jgi:hypothetical protein
MVKFNFDVKKKHLIFVALFVGVLGLGFVSAQVNKNLPWHPAGRVEIDIDGNKKNLQQARDEGLFGGGYSVVQDEGSPLTQRAILNFAGGGVQCSDGASKTTCTISGGGGGGTFTSLTDTPNSYASWQNRCVKVKNDETGLEFGDCGGGGGLWSQSGNNIYYNTGKVGVGTNDPLSLFHLKQSTPAIRLEDSSGRTWRVISAGDGKLSFGYTSSRSGNPLTKVTFDGSSGAVGIGTSSPTSSYSLHVKNDDDHGALIQTTLDNSQTFPLAVIAGGSTKLLVKGGSSGGVFTGSSSDTKVISGWERKSCTDSPVETLNCACPPGKKLLGGGAATTGSASYLLTSYPSSDTNWFVKSATDNTRITINILCANV